MPVSVQLAALPPLLEEAARDGVESEIGQWAAVASVVTGALMTALGHGGPAPTPHFEWRCVRLVRDGRGLPKLQPPLLTIGLVCATTAALTNALIPPSSSHALARLSLLPRAA